MATSGGGRPETGRPRPLRRLCEAAEQLGRFLWSRRELVVEKTDHETKGLEGVKARAEFWTEFRKGQREAHARASEQQRGTPCSSRDD